MWSGETLLAQNKESLNQHSAKVQVGNFEFREEPTVVTFDSDYQLLIPWWRTFGLESNVSLN
jgi:hypothetical protein